MARIAKITARKARMTEDNDRGLYTAVSLPDQYPTYQMKEKGCPDRK